MKLFNPLSGNEFIKIIDFLAENTGEEVRLKDLMKVDFNQKNMPEIFRKISKDKYYKGVTSPIPIVPTTPEKIWLKHVLKDSKARLFLNPQTLKKLEELLGATSDIIDGSIIYKNNGVNDSNNVDEIKGNFKIIMDALLNQKGITCTYHSKNGGVYSNQKALPLKIEYSVKDDVFYLIYYSILGEKVVKGIIKNFSELAIIDLEEDLRQRAVASFSEYIEKEVQSIIMEVKEDNNGLERTFYLFSCFKKSAKYLKKEDKYIFQLSYYTYEKMEVIHRILSLGKSVKVIEPEEIREEIISRVKKALEKY